MLHTGIIEPDVKSGAGGRLFMSRNGVVVGKVAVVVRKSVDIAKTVIVVVLAIIVLVTVD